MRIGWTAARRPCARRRLRRLASGILRIEQRTLKPRPVFPGGARWWAGSLAVLLAAAGPGEGEGLAFGVVEQVGVDRSGETWIVQLDREIVAALVGALRPGGSDLGAADKDPMAGGVVVGPVGLGDDADALRLDAQGSNLAPEFLAGFLEGADVRHVISPWCSSPRPSRPRWRSAGRRRSTTHPSAGRSAAEDGGGETFLSSARNGRSPGEESRSTAVAAEAIEAQ